MNFTKTATLLGLIAGSAMALAAMPAQAGVISFGNGTDGIKFDTDTPVDFWLISTQGKFKSKLSVVEAADKSTSVFDLFTETEKFDTATDDFMGTCPKTVSNSQDGVSCHNWFTFKKDVEYSLLLDSTPNGQVWSTDDLNTPTSIQAIFTPMGDNLYKIAFDDKGNKNDTDFQDFIVKAEIKDVPEPAALAGLGVVAGAMTLVRRRKNNKGA